MSMRCGKGALQAGVVPCVDNAGHTGPCTHYRDIPRNEKANCCDGSCGRCGGCYETIREEFNRAADERDELKAEVTALRALWTNANHAAQELAAEVKKLKAENWLLLADQGPDHIP